MESIRFDGKVVVVTGAGSGIGKAYALLFASKGASVVVNDLGGDINGDGSSTKSADAVANEIRMTGGIAVADYHSVVEGDKIITTALDNFGRVDILINNAGILRDRSLPKMTKAEWDLVLDVHLKGSFKTTQAAFLVMKKQKFGRIIMTSSNSGIYGVFGQANYAAAKMGLIGLAKTVAIEGAKYNVFCNVIVPSASSRLNINLEMPKGFEELKPDFIAPVVAFLCHESCGENGLIIEASGGWAGMCEMVRSNGTILRASKHEKITLESVRSKWSKITNMKKAKTFSNVNDVLKDLIECVEDRFEESPSRKKGNVICLKNFKKGAAEDKSDTTLTISDDDFMLIMEGKMQPQQAFIKGKLNISGNSMLAQRLRTLFEQKAKL